MYRKNIKIEMWNGDKFISKKYYADAFFYPHGSFGYYYRGNIYDKNGKCIGDYGAKNIQTVNKNFII